MTRIDTILPMVKRTYFVEISPCILVKELEETGSTSQWGNHELTTTHLEKVRDPLRGATT